MRELLTLLFCVLVVSVACSVSVYIVIFLDLRGYDIFGSKKLGNDDE